MTKSTHHEHDILSYKLINEPSHEHDPYDSIINASNMTSNSTSSINELVTLNTMSNIRSHSNLVALSTILNMKYFIINSVALNTTSNMKYSSAYLVALIILSNMASI